MFLKVCIYALIALAFVTTVVIGFAFPGIEYLITKKFVFFWFVGLGIGAIPVLILATISNILHNKNKLDTKNYLIIMLIGLGLSGFIMLFILRRQEFLPLFAITFFTSAVMFWWREVKPIKNRTALRIKK